MDTLWFLSGTLDGGLAPRG